MVAWFGYDEFNQIVPGRQLIFGGSFAGGAGTGCDQFHVRYAEYPHGPPVRPIPNRRGVGTGSEDTQRVECGPVIDLENERRGVGKASRWG